MFTLVICQAKQTHMLCLEGPAKRSFRTRAVSNKEALRFLKDNWDEMVSSGQVVGLDKNISDTSGSKHGRRMRSKIMKFFSETIDYSDENLKFSESDLSDALHKNWASRRRSCKESAASKQLRKLKSRYAVRPNTTLTVYFSFAHLLLVCAVSEL